MVFCSHFGKWVAPRIIPNPINPHSSGEWFSAEGRGEHFCTPPPAKALGSMWRYFWPSLLVWLGAQGWQCSWNLVAKGQACCQTSCHAQDAPSPRHKELSSPKANSVQIEKPAFRTSAAFFIDRETPPASEPLCLKPYNAS